MRWLSRLVTLTLLGGVVAGLVWYAATRATPRTVGQRFATWGLFRDASHLPVGSRVMLGGVQVGEIDGLAVEGELARVSMRLRDDVVLYDDAWAEKRTESLFGDGYVAIFAGHDGPGRRRLRSGEPIPRVVEGGSADTVLRDLDRGLPRADEQLSITNDAVARARQVVAGPLATRLDELDRAVPRGELTGLHTVDDALGRLEARLDRAADVTAGAAPRVHRALDDLSADVAGVTQDLRDGRAAFRRAMGDARAGMDRIDPAIADAVDVVRALDGDAPAEDQGTLARLINDPGPGDAIASGVEDVKDFTSSLSRLETWIGLRSEFNFRSLQPRFYVTAELAGRNDSFYLVELEKSSLGDVPEVSLTDAPGTDRFVRSVVIHERVRYTLQWGKRISNAIAVRFGIKDSSFGIGGDALMMDGQLRLSADLFGGNMSQLPRLKLAAALEVFRSIYVLAGVDDILSAPGALPIAPWPASQDVPIQFEELRYGRDYFLGAMLRFDDEDLSTLLAVYGAVIVGLL
ncbi:MAG: MCE family protein [Kofleriaceae bacterium]|nr:MCE family protein [Kofleriaceae bacterium]